MALTLTDDSVLPTGWQNKPPTAFDDIHQSADIPAAASSVPPGEVVESPDTVSRTCSSRPSFGPLLAKRPNTWVTRSLDVIEAIEVQANSLSKKLTFNTSLQDEAAMRKILVQAAKEVEAAGISLNLVTSKSEYVLSYKRQVTELLRSIDSRISVLGAGLCSSPVEKGRVMVEAGKRMSMSRFAFD